MGMWSEINTKAIVHKSKHVSIDKIAHLIFNDYKLNLLTEFDGDFFIHKIELHYEEDGDRAYKMASKFIKELESCGASCYGTTFCIRMN